jgi:diguanylate cyclase (GGDEF)-like protein
MDPKTGFTVAVVMMLLNAGILGVMHRGLSADVQPSAEDWRLGTLLVASGTILLISQAWLPPDFVLPAANMCLFTGVSLYWRSVRRFQGLPDRIWVFVPVVVGTIGIAVFTLWMPSLRGRVVVTALTWLPPLLMSARLLWTDKYSERERSQRVLAVMFALVASFGVIRGAIFAVFEIPAKSILDSTSPVNFLTPVLMATLPVIGTTAFLFMCSERIRRQWELAAATDYLTGMPNRRTITVSAESRFASARRTGAPFAVAVIDVDHFKQVNDRFGHDIGDHALRHVAGVLEKSCRGPLMVGRFGGEEFVALFEDADVNAARAAAERIRHAVESAPLTLFDNTHHLTVSVGVGVMRGTDGRIEDILRRADSALYTAKANGRNRVEI